MVEEELEMVWTWLYDQDLLDNPNGKELPLEWVLYRFQAFSKCYFRDTVGKTIRWAFLYHLWPCEDKLAAIQIDIGVGLGLKVPLASGPHSAHLGEATLSVP